MKTVTKGNEGAEQGALAVISREFKEARGAVEKFLAGRLPVDFFLNSAGLCFRKNPDLAQCTIESRKYSVRHAAQLGLIPGLQVHFLPFKDNKTGATNMVPVIDYKGLIDIARRSGEVKDVYARVVREGEPFRVRGGTNPGIDHEPDYASTKPVVAAYAVIKLMNGADHFDVMSEAEIQRVRQCSRAASSGPWVNFPDEMRKKTVLRRACKTAPFSMFPPEVHRKLQEEEDVEFNRAKLADFNIVDEPGPEPPKAPPKPQKTTIDPADPAALRNELKTILAKMNVDVSDKLLFEAGVEDLNACADPEKLQAAIQLAKDSQEGS